MAGTPGRQVKATGPLKNARVSLKNYIRQDRRT